MAEPSSSSRIGRWISPGAATIAPIHRGASASSRVQSAMPRATVSVAPGIVVGLASLVQGYDSDEPFRTVVLAIAIGVIGLGIIYGTTARR
jgi:hypothetical protein